MECVKKNKSIIIVPRKKENGEHINNHQEEIAKEMMSKSFAKIANNYEELKEIVTELLKEKEEGREKERIYLSNNENFNDKLIEYIESI